MGLPSFKIVGGLWAVHRLLCERVRLDAAGTSMAGLRDRVQGRDLGLLTASAGNWGRAVAAAARWLSVRATVLVPGGTGAARISAIESEGALVEVVAGNFDAAVAAAAARAGEPDLLVADASDTRDDPFPDWVTDGYETLFAEVDDDLARSRAATPDVVVVPVGAGAFAAAASRHYGRASTSRLLGVEPHEAASAMASAREGRIVTVPAATVTPMTGMNCGTPSAVAWPAIIAGFAAFCSISDATAEEGMRALARSGIAAGACSGALVGATHELALGPDPSPRQALGLSQHSSVLLLLTEGVTDPEHYRSVVGPDACGHEA